MRIFLGTAFHPNCGTIQISAIFGIKGTIEGWYTEELADSVNGNYWRDTGINISGKTPDEAWSYLSYIYNSEQTGPYLWNREENYTLQ